MDSEHHHTHEIGASKMSYGKVWEHKDAEHRAEALARLRTVFPQGSWVTTTVKHVTKSGMGRTIMVLAYDPETGRITNRSGDVARVLDWRFDNERYGVYVEGCGMDMAFHLTYTLARVLYANDGGVRDANGVDAGYLLNQNTI
jgi:hypothetical protein